MAGVPVLRNPPGRIRLHQGCSVDFILTLAGIVRTTSNSILARPSLLLHSYREGATRSSYLSWKLPP
eukprot:scaffold1842_cov148-Amphora_coffeaeformis.AAC.4